MRFIGRKVGRLLALGAALGLVLAACGGGDDTGGTAPDPNGVLRVGYDLVASSRGGFQLDPARSPTSVGEDGLYHLIYGRLMVATQEGELEPGLAERATVVDPNAIEIVVRDGVTFQDGVPFDAEAVEAGLERTLAANNQAGFPATFFDLQAVDVTGPNTVRLTVSNGTAASWYDTYLGSWETTIVRPDTDFSQPVGAGPMRLTEYVPEQRIVLEKWDDYWDAESILAGGMELLHVSVDEPQSGIAALQAGQIDFVQSDVAQLPAITGNLGSLAEPDANRLYALHLCKQEGPLADPRVRRALNMSIDRDAINEAIFAGTSEPATELWPEGHRFHNPDVADELAYDPEAARDLLEDAGYADGFSFTVYVLQAANVPETVEVIQQQLAEVGVTIDIEPAPNYVQDFLVPPRPGAGAITGSQEAHLRLGSWSGSDIGNTCHYDDAELNALQRQLNAMSMSSDEAVELWHQIDELVVRDALSVFIVYGANVVAYDADRLSDVARWPLGNIVIPDVRQTSVNS